MKKTWDTIDLAKFIASILIFTMHCNVLGDYQNAGFFIEVLARWGVPFFFICSSYFLFSKSVNGQISKETIRKYMFRVGMLYLVWFIYNLPNVIYQRLYSKDLTAVSTWLIFIKNSILSSTFTGSWYLASSIFSAYFVYLLSKKLKTKTILLITSVFYILCVLTSAYRGALPSRWDEVLHFLCFPLNIFNGCFYFALGKLAVENQSAILRVFTKKRALICFVVFYAFFAAELYFTDRYGIIDSTDVAFSTAAIALALFLYCIQTSRSFKNALLMRKLSTIIYCCQGNVLLVNGFCKKILGIPSVIAYAISAVIVAVICAAVVYIQKKKNWKWSKYLT